MSETARSNTPSKQPAKKPALTKRIKDSWSTFCTAHPWLARIGIALLVCAILWLIFWFLLFSGMNESADFIYAQF